MRVRVALALLLPLATAKWHSLLPFLRAASASAGSEALVLDVGTNNGDFTNSIWKYPCPVVPDPKKKMYANICCNESNKSAASSITYIAFEPQPQFREMLEQLQPKCETHRFEFHAVAAWKAEGNMSFLLRGDSRASSLNVAFSSSHRARHLLVRTIDLADFILKKARWEHINFLKLDVEAAEYLLLPHLLSHGALCYFDFIFVEWHLSMVTPAKRLAALSLRLAFNNLLEEGCPARKRGPRLIEHDELQNNARVYVPGLSTRTRYQNGPDKGG